MPETTELFLRDQLLARRQRLESAVRAGGRPEGITELLSEIDAALARMEAGTYGLCETCHEPVEKERLLIDPLVQLCLEHLNSQQRRALEQDLELAARLQRGLLPQANLKYEGWTVAYHYRPLGPVSGDYCDLVAGENGGRHLLFAFGDVAGKGVAASMLMSQLHAIFRTLAASDLPISGLVEHASRVFCQATLPALYATLVCGRADASGGIELCNAGHCPPFVVGQGKIAPLEATGVPLGMFCDGHYSTRRVALAPGEALFLYTDGLLEARSRGGEEYGERRLAEVLAGQRDLDPEALIRACLGDLSSFCAGQPLHDDLTLMALQRSV